MDIALLAMLHYLEQQIFAYLQKILGWEWQALQ
jgi:hypothetical protein